MAQPISSADFDSDLNLINPDFQGPVVILFWSSGCPHCTHYHPTFQQAAQEAAKYGVRFLEVHTPDNPDLMTAVENHSSPKFKVDGIPTIVSYNTGLLMVQEGIETSSAAFQRLYFSQKPFNKFQSVTYKQLAAEKVNFKDVTTIFNI